MKKQTKRLSINEDPDMQGAMPALMRAVKRAHKIAHQTGTNIVTMRDGKVVEAPPDPEKYNDASISSGMKWAEES